MPDLTPLELRRASLRTGRSITDIMRDVMSGRNMHGFTVSDAPPQWRLHCEEVLAADARGERPLSLYIYEDVTNLLAGFTLDADDVGSGCYWARVVVPSPDTESAEQAHKTRSAVAALLDALSVSYALWWDVDELFGSHMAARVSLPYSSAAQSPWQAAKALHAALLRHVSPETNVGVEQGPWVNSPTDGPVSPEIAWLPDPDRDVISWAEIRAILARSALAYIPVGEDEMEDFCVV